MNWYRIAETSKPKSRINKVLRRIVDDYSDDGVSMWTKGNNVFISVGDWAKNTEDIMAEVRRFFKDNEIRCESESNPGAGWDRV